MKGILFITIILSIFISKPAISQDSIPWHHYSSTESNYRGISLQQGLDFMKEKGKVQRTVIVAIIDSGIDTLHEDLRPKLWHNPKEIPYNNIDDDGNGYIDDIYGWNFIGGSNGKNIDGETLELIRFYKLYRDKFEGKEKKNIAKENRSLFKKWTTAKAEIKKERSIYQEQKDGYTEWELTLRFCETIIRKRLEIDTLTTENVKRLHLKMRRKSRLNSLFLTLMPKEFH